MEFMSYLSDLRRIYAEFGESLTESPPAANADLTLAEEQLGKPMDPGLRTAWAIADGVAGAGDDYRPVFVRPGYLTPFSFLSAEEALEARASLRRRAPQYEDYEDPRPRDPRIQDGWFQDGWLPFAEFDGSTLLISDMSPSRHGVEGQIIGFVHDPDEIVFVAAGFSELLDASLEMLRQSAHELFED